MFEPLIADWPAATSPDVVIGGALLGAGVYFLLKMIWGEAPAADPADEPPFDDTEELRTQLQLREWELELTRHFLRTRDRAGRLEMLLKSLEIPENQGFAAVFRIVGSELRMEQSHGLSPESRQKLALSPRMLRETISSGVVVTSVSEAPMNQNLLGLTVADRASLSKFYGVRLGNIRHPWGVLITTHLPAVQPSEPATRDAWEHLATILGEELASQETVSRQGDELALTREMLELRSMADLQFRSPTHLFQEFLKRLAELSDFERATLIISGDEYQLTAPSVVRGGGALSRELVAVWEAAEYRLMAEAASSTGGTVWTERDLSQIGLQGPFSMAVVLPLRYREWIVGRLCLSRRSGATINENDRRLIQWGTEFLVDLIARTVDRAAVEQLARLDGLTQLANRHTFDTELDRAVDRANRTGDDCALVILDLDHFKSVNDTHGHLGGDAALATVARVVERSVQASRTDDNPLVARYGGEELVVLLPGVGEPGARRIAESIREAVGRTPIHHDNEEFHVTISAGVAARNGAMVTSRSMVSSADTALYRAKQNGRNRVEVAEHAIHS
jgi:diguanylate cyclase (GGDEF)-like protein